TSVDRGPRASHADAKVQCKTSRDGKMDHRLDSRRSLVHTMICVRAERRRLVAESIEVQNVELRRACGDSDVRIRVLAAHVRRKLGAPPVHAGRISAEQACSIRIRSPPEAIAFERRPTTNEQ